MREGKERSRERENREGKERGEGSGGETCRKRDSVGFGLRRSRDISGGIQS